MSFGIARQSIKVQNQDWNWHLIKVRQFRWSECGKKHSCISSIQFWNILCPPKSHCCRLFSSRKSFWRRTLWCTVKFTRVTSILLAAIGPNTPTILVLVIRVNGWLRSSWLFISSSKTFCWSIYSSPFSTILTTPSNPSHLRSVPILYLDAVVHCLCCCCCCRRCEYCWSELADRLHSPVFYISAGWRISLHCLLEGFGGNPTMS